MQWNNLQSGTQGFTMSVCQLQSAIMVSSSLSFRRYVLAPLAYFIGLKEPKTLRLVSSPCPRVSRAWKWDEGHRLKGPWLRKTRLETGIVEGLLWTTPISIAAMIQLTWIGKMSCIYLRYQISPLMIPALKLLQLASSGQRVREGPLLLIDNLHKGRSLENIFWYSIAFDMFSSFHITFTFYVLIESSQWRYTLWTSFLWRPTRSLRRVREEMSKETSCTTSFTEMYWIGKIN